MHTHGRIRIRVPSKRAAADLRRRPRGHQHVLFPLVFIFPSFHLLSPSPTLPDSSLVIIL
jgi:hypothetical protein